MGGLISPFSVALLPTLLDEFSRLQGTPGAEWYRLWLLAVRIAAAADEAAAYYRALEEEYMARADALAAGGV